MQHVPFDYQFEGIDYLAGRKAALLADEPGLGKTLQVIRAADAVLAMNVLIICPASLVTNWRREIEMQRTGFWKAFVVSYEMATGKYLRAILEQDWCVVAIDEAHYLKNRGTKRACAVYGMHEQVMSINYKLRQLMKQTWVMKKAIHKWLITGTPMPNHAGELYPHVRELRPDLITGTHGFPLSLEQWTNKYCVQRVNGFGKQIVGTKNHEHLHGVLKDFMIRRKAKDVLGDLPPITWSPIYMEAEEPEELQILSDEDVDNLIGLIEAGGSLAFGRVRDLALTSMRRLTALAKVKPTIGYIKDFLASTDQKLIVFGYHRDPLRMLFHEFQGNAVEIHGGVTSGTRQKRVDIFQEDPGCRLAFLQIQAAGVGLTMTAATEALFLEQSWVPAENAQAAKRIHRIGQMYPCRIKTAVISNSVDEKVNVAILRKSRDIAFVVDGENVESSEFILST